MEYLGAWGTLIHEKNLKSKISCQTPFNAQYLLNAFISAWNSFLTTDISGDAFKRFHGRVITLWEGFHELVVTLQKLS